MGNYLSTRLNSGVTERRRRVSLMDDMSLDNSNSDNSAEDPDQDLSTILRYLISRLVIYQLFCMVLLNYNNEFAEDT